MGLRRLIEGETLMTHELSTMSSTMIESLLAYYEGQNHEATRKILVAELRRRFTTTETDAVA